MLFQIAGTFFTPVPRLKELCSSSQHEFALHVHSEECCTWLCFIYLFIYTYIFRLQTQGEKLCRIICKFDRETKQETDVQPAFIVVHLLAMELQCNRGSLYRGSLEGVNLSLIAQKTFTHNVIKIMMQASKVHETEINIS